MKRKWNYKNISCVNIILKLNCWIQDVLYFVWNSSHSVFFIGEKNRFLLCMVRIIFTARAMVRDHVPHRILLDDWYLWYVGDAAATWTASVTERKTDTDKISSYWWHQRLLLQGLLQNVGWGLKAVHSCRAAFMCKWAWRCNLPNISSADNFN